MQRSVKDAWIIAEFRQRELGDKSDVSFDQKKILKIKVLFIGRQKCFVKKIQICHCRLIGRRQ